ncbi:hypothetical protein [Curvivirga sp.]|uniref:hypothetical protein n=1 Tax=Curvivirga sp. TaxID=2856848 RepID=UPI003B592213
MQKNRSVVGLYSAFGNWPIPPQEGRGLIARFKRASWSLPKRRGKEYMLELFQEQFPDGEFIDTDENEQWLEKVGNIDTVVLLFPDAIGHGFTEIYAKTSALIDERTNVLVLNGRRRLFHYNKKAQRALCIRRFLEKWMVGEFIFVIPFVLITPFFLIVDFLKGRK